LENEDIETDEYFEEFFGRDYNEAHRYFNFVISFDEEGHYLDNI